MWTHRLIAQLVAALALVLALSLPAAAAPSDVDSPEITRGDRGLGLDVDVFDEDDGTVLLLVPGVGFAPTDWAAIGLEVGFLDAPDADLTAEVAVVEVTLAPPGQDGPWTLGAKASLAAGLEEGVPESAGVTLLAARGLGALSVLANLGVGRELGGGADLALDYGLRLEGSLGDGTLALEILGDLGEEGDFGLGRERATSAGVALGGAVGRWELEAGAFAGLTDAAPDGFLRLRLAVGL